MKNKRTLAGFDKVANINTNANVNINTSDNVIENILADPPAKKMVGIYFDSDVAEALDRVSTKRGAKSAIVNEVVRRLLTEKGML